MECKTWKKIEKSKSIKGEDSFLAKTIQKGN